MYISDLAEEYLLDNGHWKNNPKKDEDKSDLARLLAGKQWDRETMAFAAGYVKCLEQFNEILKRYYNISFLQVAKGNIDFTEELQFANDKIDFIQQLKVHPEFDKNN